MLPELQVRTMQQERIAEPALYILYQHPWNSLWREEGRYTLRGKGFAGLRHQWIALRCPGKPWLALLNMVDWDPNSESEQNWVEIALVVQFPRGKNGDAWSKMLQIRDLRDEYFFELCSRIMILYTNPSKSLSQIQFLLMMGFLGAPFRISIPYWKSPILPSWSQSAARTRRSPVQGLRECITA